MQAKMPFQAYLRSPAGAVVIPKWVQRQYFVQTFFSSLTSTTFSGSHSEHQKSFRRMHSLCKVTHLSLCPQQHEDNSLEAKPFKEKGEVCSTLLPLKSEDFGLSYVCSFAVTFKGLCNQLINPWYREVTGLFIFGRCKIKKEDEQIT